MGGFELVGEDVVTAHLHASGGRADQEAGSASVATTWPPRPTCGQPAGHGACARAHLEAPGS
jgi:hypothetical protein